jgi:DNA-directed RNA polymerase alpha subunit
MSDVNPQQVTLVIGDCELIITILSHGVVQIFGTFRGLPLEVMDGGQSEMAISVAGLDEKVCTLGISVRTANVLEVSVPRIRYVGELVRLTESDLLDRRRFPHLGKRGVAEIKQKLAAHDPPLTLGMNLEGIWPPPEGSSG